MIVGKVSEYIALLNKGQAIVIPPSDIQDSARCYLDSGFDHVRPEYIRAVLAEINSEEYSEFTIAERPDGNYVLRRY